MFLVVVGIKDTVYWKQFTTLWKFYLSFLCCCWYQRYCLLKAIHNMDIIGIKAKLVVVGIKDTVYWKQFTTTCIFFVQVRKLLLVSKMLFIESNSQQLLFTKENLTVVVGIKDTVYWKQFTTSVVSTSISLSLLLVSKILFIESNSQLQSFSKLSICVVVGIKDTVYWKQFTTLLSFSFSSSALLLVSKILFIESNSQLWLYTCRAPICCCWYQRYCLLKAIHNMLSCQSLPFFVVVGIKDTVYWKQFTTKAPVIANRYELLLVSKILFIESNSQQVVLVYLKMFRCCWYQRYCLLKAIHNIGTYMTIASFVVVGIKDTVYWKQFTTAANGFNKYFGLLLVSKILFIESNSQLNFLSFIMLLCCCWYQRYCLLKAIHNVEPKVSEAEALLLVSKILFIESNSQHKQIWRKCAPGCCWYQRYCLLKAIHNFLKTQL